jgi:hypothetical protein
MDGTRAGSYCSSMPNGRTDVRRRVGSPWGAARDLALLAFAAALALPAAATAISARFREPAAHAARTLSVADTAHLRYRGSSGSALIEEGPASGGLPGTVKVRFNVGASVSAAFTISTAHGAVIGRGTGALHSSGMYASFGGSMVVTSGTGRYRHAHGHGGFYGVINRRTYALTVQTTGRLSY